MSTVNTAGRAYLREFGGAMLCYSIATPIALVVARQHPDAAWRFPVVLIPMIPALFALWAFVRFFGRMDELQRRIQLEALALSFGGTGILTLTYGFLENVGLPRLSYTYVWPVMSALWLLGLLFANRRYC